VLLPGHATVPALAEVFGDGDHPTTRLCATLLARALHRAPRSAVVLDAGTGTGVLARRALQRGARVVAIDHEPGAIRQARIALAHWLCTGQAELVCSTIEAFAATAGRFDIAVANLPVPPLVASIPVLAATLKPGGQLVLSGALLWQGRAVRRAVAAAGLEELDLSCQVGWCALRAHHTDRK
jgi:ribosomal protein L11 methyltransferase